MAYLDPILVIFLIIFVGIIYAQSRSVTTDHVDGLDTFLFRIFMPCYFFMLMYNHNLSTLIDLKYMSSFLLTFLLTALCTLLLNFRKHSYDMNLMHVFSSTYVNSAVFTLPVTIYLLQDPRAAVLGNFLQIIFIQSVFVIFFSFAKQGQVSWLQRLQNALLNPMLGMPLAGLACNWLDLTPHAVVLGAVKALGDAAPAVALCNFGLSLGTTRIKDLSVTPLLVRLVVIKNVIHPMIAFIVGAFIFGLQGYWLWALVLMTSAPPGFITLRFAKTHHLNPALIKAVMVVSGVVALIILFVTTVTLSVLKVDLTQLSVS